MHGFQTVFEKQHENLTLDWKHTVAARVRHGNSPEQGSSCQLLSIYQLFHTVNWLEAAKEEPGLE